MSAGRGPGAQEPSIAAATAAAGDAPGEQAAAEERALE